MATPLDLACPRCKAHAGEQCHTPVPEGAGVAWVRVKSDFHAERERALIAIQNERARLPEDLRPPMPQAPQLCVQEIPIEPACTCATHPFPHYHNEMDSRSALRRFNARVAPLRDNPFRDEVHA